MNIKESARIRTLIVDDERLARDLIRTLLQAEADVEVVGESTNGSEAVTAIERFRPDLVFLDVKMPSLDGFDVLAALKGQPLPLIVFVTAHDRHALRAFEVHALDYLLKPFEYDRLRHSVARAREQLARRDQTGFQERVFALLKDLKPASAFRHRIEIREAGRILYLKTDEIDWVEAEGNYLRLHAGKKSHLLRETMHALEAGLAQAQFARVNRSTLLNLDRVKEIQPLFHGDAAVILQDGTRLTLSRVFRREFDCQMVNTVSGIKKARS